MFYLSYESSEYEKKLLQAHEQNKKEINEARLVIETSQYSGEENSIAQILQKQIDDLQKGEEVLLKVNLNLMKTNKDLDNFIYTASHDLRAPIANLEGLINTIRIHRYDEGNEDMSQIVDMMMTSVIRFKNTISELTEISKLQKDIEQGEDIDFEQLFDEVKFSLSNLISKADAIIVSDFKSCPQINFTKKNLRSIIYNLVNNAIKYRSPNRQLKIFISTEKLENGKILLTIKDNGLGIRKEHNQKIFSMFKRAHSHVEGSGVGLYIVKRIMDNCGGQIELESDEDQGAVFKLYF